MTDLVTVAWISAGTSLGTIILTMFNSFMIARAKKIITLLEKNTNSIKDELVKVTGDAEFAKGLKQGQEEKL